MSNNILGIHHVTAISGNAQENVDFYTGVLGLRLVKKTVNFDDPATYHLYFGNEDGTPGTIITFFPWRRTQRPNWYGTIIYDIIFHTRRRNGFLDGKIQEAQHRF